MDVAEMTAEIHVENIAELEVGLVKVKEAVEYLIEAGILRIPEDVSREDIEKRTRIALMNTIILKTEIKS